MQKSAVAEPATTNPATTNPAMTNPAMTTSSMRLRAFKPALCFFLPLLAVLLLAVPLAAQFNPLKGKSKPKAPETPPLAMVPPPPPVGPTAGSIFVPAGRIADAARDFRASQIDDLITIVVNENASAVVSGVTNTQRKSQASSAITSLLGLKSANGALSNLANANTNVQLQGTGQTSRVTTLTTTLSARVIGVSANGTLLIEGTKDINVNSEHQTIVVRGLVRPEDLTTANMVASTSVTNLKIAIDGKGVVNDAIRRPNILYRILLGLLPF